MERAMPWPSTQSVLVRAIRDWRNEEAWRAFVDRYGPLLYRLCTRQGLQDADAADIVQNVLARVSRAVERFDRDRGKFRTWLITITSREIQRYRESRAARPCGGRDREGAERVEAELTAAWAVECEVQRFECALERVREALDGLEWQAFQMVWNEKRKPIEVAADVGKNVQWVYRTKRKALSRLREEVQVLADGDA